MGKKSQAHMVETGKSIFRGNGQVKKSGNQGGRTKNFYDNHQLGQGKIKRVESSPSKVKKTDVASRPGKKKGHCDKTRKARWKVIRPHREGGNMDWALNGKGEQ